MSLDTIIARLDHSHGINQMSDAVALSFKLIEKGVNCVAEMAPGSPIDGLNVFYLKVNQEDQELAIEHLRQALSEPRD